MFLVELYNSTHSNGNCGDNGDDDDDNDEGNNNSSDMIVKFLSAYVILLYLEFKTLAF